MEVRLLAWSCLGFILSPSYACVSVWCFQVCASGTFLGFTVFISKTQHGDPEVFLRSSVLPFCGGLREEQISEM